MILITDLLTLWYKPARRGKSASANDSGSCEDRWFQKGFSLVELMVAMLISSIVVIGIIQIFVSNRESFRVQANLGRLQENSRFALEHFSRVVRLAGYQGDDAGDWVLGPLSTTNGGVVPIGGTNNNVSGSDTVTVFYMGNADGFVRDCQGTQVGAGDVVGNQFSLNGSNQLQCATNLNGAAFGAAVPLIDDVEALHVLYGLDSDGDGSANQYVPSTGVANFENVVSVRIGLLLLSADDGVTPLADTNNYVVVDETIAAPGDRRLRRVLTTTIELRNKS
jgi:type IV pilus assembly protein PilW